MSDEWRARNRAWLQQKLAPANAAFDDYIVDPLNRAMPGQWGNNLKGLLSFSKELSPGMDIVDQQQGMLDIKEGLLRRDPAQALRGAGLTGLGVFGMVAPGIGDGVRGAGKEMLQRASDLDDLGFYSPTQRLATTLQEKGTGDQYLNILKKGDGKGARIQEEMQDMGLDAWLKGKGKVTRDEILDFIENNRLRYERKTLRDFDPNDTARDGDISVWWTDESGVKGAVPFEDLSSEGRAYIRGRYQNDVLGYGDDVGDAKYQDYAQTGGTDYQENLLKVPSEGAQKRWDELDKEYTKTINEMNSLPYGSPEREKLGHVVDDMANEMRELDKVKSSYTPPHYDGEPNLALTTRTQSFNTTDGKRVHLMDELQSDWHQAGKKKGYKDEATQAPMLEWEANYKRLTDESKKIKSHSEDLDLLAELEMNPQKAEELKYKARDYRDSMNQRNTQIAREIDALGPRPRGGEVPNAPAKQSWMNQGIKKEINQAIADGKDYYAWTGGDIQADRYSLRKQIERIDYDVDSGNLVAHDDIGNQVLDRRVGLDELDEMIGKEAADKIRSQTRDIRSNRRKLDTLREQNKEIFSKMKSHVDNPDDTLFEEYNKAHKAKLKEIDSLETQYARLEGEQLEVGGEGMKSFYDKDVRKRTEKILKQLDPKAKIEVIELDNGNKVWGVKITDEMKGKVKSDGMPLYSVGGLLAGGAVGAGLLSQQEQKQQQGLIY